MTAEGEVTIRTYQGGDEKAIFNLWNRSFPQEGISWKWFLKKTLLDPNFDPEGAIVAEKDGEITGFTYCVERKVPMWGTDLETDTAWLTIMFVDPKLQRQGIGTAMLERVYTFLKSKGKKKLQVSPYTPNYFFPGVDPKLYPAADQFFAKHGFQITSQPVAMEASLRFFAIPPEVKEQEQALANEGITIQYIEPKYFIPLFKTIGEHFSAEWLRAAREALQYGMDYDHVLVAVRETADGPEVVGWCQYNAYDGIPERFGPFGVVKAMRGKKIGKVLLYRCMETMRQKGLHSVWFLWTSLDSPAGKLYQKAGFKAYRQFNIYEKGLAK